jgi:4-hydroxybenzoate polyprenyltransferase
MRQPDLLESHPPHVQLVLAIVVPAAFGGIVGLLLGVTEIGYLIGSLLGIAGGYLAGKEHVGGEDGALRGFTGGILFGTFILAGHAATGLERKAHLPEPELLLVVITTVFGIVLGALGGRSRAKLERREGIRSEVPVAQSADADTPLSTSAASSTPPSS